jgi:heme-degrading monooxygenase HmoA
MIITIFRSRLRPEHAAEYATMAAKMNTLVQTMPGYVSHKTFTAEDGERVTIVAFETREAHMAWAGHPHHREAQRAGKARFYSEYRIEICEVARSYAGPP